MAVLLISNVLRKGINLGLSTDSEAHRLTYQMDIGDKDGQDVNQTTHLHPVPRSRAMEL
jgi:hypothetical protein